MEVDLATAKEIFIDATFNTSKVNSHLYAIVGQELGYSVPLGFMLMEIHPKEDTRKNKHEGEAKQCNKNFYQAAKEMGLDPIFVHTDKDWAEISAAQVFRFQLGDSLSYSALVDYVSLLLDIDAGIS